jgi:capsular polysaccharide export protein
MKSGYIFYLYNFIEVFKGRNFRGWGRKRTGLFAQWCYRRFGGSLTLLEDGFIRSMGLGIEGSQSFSRVEDSTGIYYDATSPSDLENILSTYDFSRDKVLRKKAKKAISLIKKYEISKYNNSPSVNEAFLEKYNLDKNKKNVLIVDQTEGDASLVYGFASKYSTKQLINDAIEENKDAHVYIKVHPDVIIGKKKSDIALADIPLSCMIIDEHINPISLLKYFDKVYTKTSGMGMEALILGVEVVCYGMPYYSGWGLTIDKIKSERRTVNLDLESLFAGAYILYPKYINSVTGENSDIIEVIDRIVANKNINISEVPYKAYFFGFSKWKHKFIKSFIPEIKDENIIFINPMASNSYLTMALKEGLNNNSKIYIWGRKFFPDVEMYARDHNIDVIRVEDGFLRSVGLGSDLIQPYSQVIDSRGIYFDPTQESDLEYILNGYDFHADNDLMLRAKKIHTFILEKKLSKYNIDNEKILSFPHNKKVILVPGQVEDDASIVYGAEGMTNLDLLKEVREKNHHAYIVYKPHPDVLAGNRVGGLEDNIALEYCDEVVKDVALDSMFACIDEVHTMTSLVGFEALLRGIEVYTYGIPFYASWGLTHDKYACKRRIRKLKLDELIAGSLILYPRYLNPNTNKLCTVEDFLDVLEFEKEKYLKSKWYKVKMKIRNYISRKGQSLIVLFR